MESPVHPRNWAPGEFFVVADWRNGFFGGWRYRVGGKSPMTVKEKMKYRYEMSTILITFLHLNAY